MRHVATRPSRPTPAASCVCAPARPRTCVSGVIQGPLSLFLSLFLFLCIPNLPPPSLSLSLSPPSLSLPRARARAFLLSLAHNHMLADTHELSMQVRMERETYSNVRAEPDSPLISSTACARVGEWISLTANITSPIAMSPLPVHAHLILFGSLCYCGGVASHVSACQHTLEYADERSHTHRRTDAQTHTQAHHSPTHHSAAAVQSNLK